MPVSMGQKRSFGLERRVMERKGKAACISMCLRETILRWRGKSEWRCGNLLCPLCSYVIDQNICFLTLADKGYPKKLAFAYLEEIKEGFARELYHDHGDE